MYSKIISKSLLGMLFVLSLVNGLALASALPKSPRSSHPEGVPLIMFSTDVANGLISTHGAQGSSPVSFSATATYQRDTAVAPQDVDDGFTLAMALNLDAQGLVEVDSIIPTYGNAPLPEEMAVALFLTRIMKQRPDIPVIPGAMAQASQTLHGTSQWFSGANVQIEGANGSFAISCRNSGVEMMYRRLINSHKPITILAIGPLTDVACLLTTSPEIKDKIAEIIILASRLEGKSVSVNGKIVNDFNFRMDPIAGALLLGSEAARKIPIRLITFSLSGQTSQSGDLIEFNSSTLKGPTPATPESQFSLNLLLQSSVPRMQFWESIFGTPQGPFDQYTLTAAVWPELFNCQPALAYIQQCPTPAWSPLYPTDSEGNPTQKPYNAPDNRCMDHGTENGASLSEIPAELVVSLNLNNPGPLIRGITGIDGNIPNLNQRALPVTACTDFASPAARQLFQELLYKYTW
ncbi:MAG: hypothetical protein HON51_11805 [Gammaproteobacteria bacterium]|jgi:pyrimidine-specific ribonucleoside hydrolase|nr:hypothetical protein [Gammaproteobacteria bacterium]MBT5825595.1 hypothetical protein [Gammaproteobacteria bacterium]MBT5966655.1 hypothetical protein [Gammaproteobacteria bacterium]MBT6420276.1 hypothetical protein [Gammaproteobacteria bacterium]MBT6576883.1 hypothetical protein [Gammaproteobacteria bacterium]